MHTYFELDDHGFYFDLTGPFGFRAGFGWGNSDEDFWGTFGYSICIFEEYLDFNTPLIER